MQAIPSKRKELQARRAEVAGELALLDLALAKLHKRKRRGRPKKQAPDLVAALDPMRKKRKRRVRVTP